MFFRRYMIAVCFLLGFFNLTSSSQPITAGKFRHKK